jgi:NTP pyrophosphatase (non-canonical NTP hydrolase)
MMEPIPAERPCLSLLAWQRHFFSQYGLRNTLFLHDPLARVALLAIAVKDLQDAIRKNAELEKVDIALARIVARIFCVAQHYQSVGISFVERFSEKYLLGTCSYCATSPCSCKDAWRKPSRCNQASQQLQWSLTRCCEELETLYGTSNRGRGLESTVNRLFSEVGEITAAIMIPFSHKGPSSQRDCLQEIGGELADILAWTIAVSNLKGVDLEQSVARRFWPVDRTCGHHPCQCGPFSFAPVDWTIIDPEKS